MPVRLEVPQVHEKYSPSPSKDMLNYPFSSFEVIALMNSQVKQQ